MKRILHSKVLYLLVRCALGLTFLYAGILKIFDPMGFAVAIDGYGLVPWSAARFLGHALPVLEIASGLGLMLDVRGSLALILFQVVVFMAVLGWGIHIGLDADCGCFGPETPKDSGQSALWESLYRDLLMFAGCLLLYWQRRAAGFRPFPAKR
ncbi:MauE/DoxX family redox-associated membrane protein [Pseudodesulfovibrio tunisiensis]|uniref:MauE/DoxX family redox-associated membrane protein n=1 Tax=Pseudodesulfovibrio tunisiensis TaxID=463192 RepID=UPI001FB43397|nr:MauE/DoxX family redox-associated membrane protein [Pseudodesulfovibrio tunisiensis]